MRHAKAFYHRLEGFTVKASVPAEGSLQVYCARKQKSDGAWRQDAAPFEQSNGYSRTMTIRRRSLLQLAGAAAAAALPMPAIALDYPNRPVRLLVGFAPSGAADILARLVAQWLSDHLGQPFIVENRPGAAMNIATAWSPKRARRLHAAQCHDHQRLERLYLQRSRLQLCT